MNPQDQSISMECQVPQQLSKGGYFELSECLFRVTLTLTNVNFLSLFIFIAHFLLPSPSHPFIFLPSLLHAPSILLLEEAKCCQPHSETRFRPVNIKCRKCMMSNLTPTSPQKDCKLRKSGMWWRTEKLKNTINKKKIIRGLLWCSSG